MRKLVLSLSILLMGLLVACSGVTIVDNTPPVVPIGSSFENPNSTAMSSTSNVAVGNAALNASQSVFYKIDIPQDAGANGIMLELEGTGSTTNLLNRADITVYGDGDSNPNTVTLVPALRSTAPDSFGTASSFTSSEQLAPQIAILPNTNCRGPCIFVPHNTTNAYILYVRVRSAVNTPITYNLLVAPREYSDAGEPTNNPDSEGKCEGFQVQSIGASVGVIGTLSAEGAIEHVNDRDCYFSENFDKSNTDKVILSIPENTVIPITMDIYNFFGSNSQSGTPAASCTVDVNKRSCTITSTPSGVLIAVVRSATGKAAPFDNSQYKVTFEFPQ